MTVLGATAALGVTLQIAAGVQARSRPIPAPRARLEGWEGAPTSPPQGDAERDRPPAVYRLYTSGEQPPLYVSVALARTLNAFRVPHRYLLDPDGRLAEGQEVLLPRPGEKMPAYLLQIIRGRSEEALALHWTQTPGDDPVPDPQDVPATIATSLVTHAPLYVCDLWTPIRPNLEVEKAKSLLLRIATQIDRQIKTGHAIP